jgi:hypothetical protein
MRRGGTGPLSGPLRASGPATRRFQFSTKHAFARRCSSTFPSSAGFNDRSIAAFAEACGYHGPSSGARFFLEARVRRPNDEFVQQAKRAIQSVWLPQHESVGRSIVRELFDMQIGPMGIMPTDALSCAQYVSRCRNSAGVRSLLRERLVSFGDRDRDGEEGFDDDFVPRFCTIDPKKQPVPRREPYAHQKEAWTRLDAHHREAETIGVFKGVLVMPTGSGKTYTAVSWLMRRWIDSGNRVLWIAHRDELLRQASKSIVSFSRVREDANGEVEPASPRDILDPAACSLDKATDEGLVRDGAQPQPLEGRDSHQLPAAA